MNYTARWVCVLLLFSLLVSAVVLALVFAAPAADCGCSSFLSLQQMLLVYACIDTGSLLVAVALSAAGLKAMVVVLVTASVLQTAFGGILARCLGGAWTGCTNAPLLAAVLLELSILTVFVGWAAWKTAWIWCAWRANRRGVQQALEETQLL